MKVSIIITAYLPSSKPYLDECVRSAKNLKVNAETEIIIVAPQSYNPQYEGVRTVNPGVDGYHNPHAINVGVRSADPDSKYLFICNDDLVLTRNSLQNMIDVAQDNMLMVNPISPCGMFSTYWLTFGFIHEGKPVFFNKPQHRYDELKPYFQSMMNAESVYPPGVIRNDWLAIFATLIPRKVIQTVGMWDEGFATSQDDLDYSWRARDRGVGMVTALNSLVFHFSGVSAETTMKIRNRLHSAKHFRDKWGMWPPGMTEAMINEWKEIISEEENKP